MIAYLKGGARVKISLRQFRFVCFLFLILMLLSSCRGEVLPLSVTEGPSVLTPEAPSKTTVGLLNPDAEVRGLWIATVGNINFPSKQGLSENELKAELEEIVSKCTELGLNTIFFQVRPAADALYDSELFPASEFVSGKQGQVPSGGIDCLKYLISIAHAVKINVHAWVNPLRVTYGSAKYPKTELTYLSEGHIARQNPNWVIPYADGKLYFDAGNPAVRDYIALGVKEIVSGYGVDGVVFDDYFYPYPVSGAEFDDSASFSSYGTGTLEDWRRENINALVKACYDAVKSVSTECLFGISPFGIWQNDDGKNGGSATKGLEAYESLYCDALAWARGGYVDYLAPQLYWRFDTKAAPYGYLSDWWNSALDGTGVKLLISHAAYMYDEWESPSGELTAQIEHSREALSYRGSVLYGYAAIASDSSKICEEITQLFDREIIYSDPSTNYKELTLSGIKDGMITANATVKITGESDPTVLLTFEGKRINRGKNGEFELEIDLSAGENKIVFIYGDKEFEFTVTKTEE